MFSEPLSEHIASISSINIIDGPSILATENKVFIIFSLSPTYLLNIVEALQLNNVHYALAAAALAKRVLPQPGAEYNKIPLQLGRLLKY